MFKEQFSFLCDIINYIEVEDDIFKILLENNIDNGFERCTCEDDSCAICMETNVALLNVNPL